VGGGDTGAVAGRAPLIPRIFDLRFGERVSVNRKLCPSCRMKVAKDW